jgi:hypothetical protein
MWTKKIILVKSGCYSPAAHINIGHDQLELVLNQINQISIFYIYLSFYPSFLGFSSFHRLDLVSTASTPWVAMVLAYLLSRRRLVRGEAPSSSAGGALDCRRNR